MNPVDQKRLLMSSCVGMARGLCVGTLLYPLETLKIHQQSSLQSKTYLKIAKELLHKEGPVVFYRGLKPYLFKTLFKPAWVFPMMTTLPPFLQRHQVPPIPQQILTGVAIATLDAALTTPLEKMKIQAVLLQKNSFSLANSWSGFTLHAVKLSVNWSTFLATHTYLKERAQKKSPKPLNPLQLTLLGSQVALVVSLISAPFDTLNTRKQAHSIQELLAQKKWKLFYRGWPLSALSLWIHNIASVFALELLRRGS